MNWVDRLNQIGESVPMGGGSVAEVLHWAYQSHLQDNVPHRHNCFEVCLVGKHGRGTFFVEGVPHDLAPGTLFIARPGVVHQIINCQTPLMELFWVTFHWAGRTGLGEIAALQTAFARAEEVVAVPDGDGRLTALWTTLPVVAGEASERVVGTDAQLLAIMGALLIAIAQAGAGYPACPVPRAASHDPRVAIANSVIEYVSDNLNRPLPVKEIASHVGLSPRHLTRLLSEITGDAPATYVERVRMERARTLLLHSDHPIKRIAAEVGYADVHHFTRVFTRASGCAPGQYRRTDGAAQAKAIGANIQNGVIAR